MIGQLPTLRTLPAQITDGADAWADFVKSAGNALTTNEAFAAAVGIGFVGLVVLFAHWKLAAWIEAFWERKHNHEQPKQ